MRGYTPRMKRPNGAARAAVAWGTVAAAGFACAALFPILRAQGVEVGCLLALAGALLAAIGAVASVVSALRARLVTRLRAGESVLAHWTYPDGVEDVLQSAGTPDPGTWRRVLFRVIVPILIAIDFLWVLASPGSMGLALSILAAGILVAGAAAALEPLVRRARRKRAPREAVISVRAAHAFGTLYAWTHLGARIVDAGVVPGKVPTLEVSYLRAAGLGTRPSTVSIPIPPGEEARASAIVCALLATRTGTPAPE
jgi:hypothetical protein